MVRHHEREIMSDRNHLFRGSADVSVALRLPSVIVFIQPSPEGRLQAALSCYLSNSSTRILQFYNYKCIALNPSLLIKRVTCSLTKSIKWTKSKRIRTLYTQISRALLQIISDYAGQIKYFFIFEDIYCIKIRDASGRIIRYPVHL